MKNKEIILIAFTAGMGAILFGYEVGVIGQVLAMENFRRDFGLSLPDDMQATYNSSRNIDLSLSLASTTSRRTSDADPSVTWHDSSSIDQSLALVTSTFLLGCIAGTRLGAFTSDHISVGRKYSILIGGAVFAAGGFLQSLAPSFSWLLVGRVVSGIAIGLLSMVVPVYISETAPADVRGALTGVYQLMITLGIVTATCVNALIITNVPDSSSSQWRLALGMQIIPSVPLIFTVAFIPRSPRFLAEHGKYEDARTALATLRGETLSSMIVEQEYQQIVLGLEAENEAGDMTWWSLLSTHDLRHRLLIGVMNQTLQQLCGINVIMYYSVVIFSTMGFQEIWVMIVFPIITALVNCLATLPGLYAVDWLGRRPLLIWGSMAIFISHLLIFIFLSLAHTDAEVSSDTYTASSSRGAYTHVIFSWCGIIAIYLFLIAFSSTWGPITWTYQSEIFPLRVRAKATSIATMTNWSWNAIIAYAFPVIFYSMGKKPTVFLLFAVIGFLMWIWSIKYIMETRGLSLEEVDEMFRAKSHSSTTRHSALPQHQKNAQYMTTVREKCSLDSSTTNPLQKNEIDRDDSSSNGGSQHGISLQGRKLLPG